MEAASALRAAEAAWASGDVRAHRLFVEIAPNTAAGREAASRLRSADVHYRVGVERFESNAPGVREALAEGSQIAPMDPALYLRLARACRARDNLLRAAELYSKYLAAAPEGDEAAQARDELRALDPTLAGVFDPPSTAGAATFAPAPAPPGPWVPVAAGFLCGVAFTSLVGASLRARRRRGLSLERLLTASPELHPAVAYLVGSLRHELLKHRVGATRDAVEGATDPTERLAFLERRLFGEPRLREAWDGHVAAFERALGPRVDLRRDPVFRRADRAIRRLARLETRVRRRDPSVLPEVRAQHEALVRFDASLAGLVAELVRTRVDVGFLTEVADAVRAEHSAGRVALDALDLRPPTEPIDLEVFRVDLVLILKNVLRNAVLAVGRAAPPRRVAVEVEVELEPTGDETVTLRVLDSSPEPLDPEVLFDRRVDRGLGLVAAAVRRYGGTIDVEAARQGVALGSGVGAYTKAVVIRFFRAAG
ncbi:MAG: hypothetical protein KF901_27825 [Myxococcales bacterium]|nr:hypothetical protein [Myxococcales bacterium]